MANPFRTEALEPGGAFCNREQELTRLEGYAEGGQNVLLFSPRRYGKTSLCKKLQHDLAARGFVCMYVDFFGVDSMEEVARRMGRSLAEAIHRRQPLLEKGKRFIGALKAFRIVLRPSPDGGNVDIGVEKASSSSDPRTLLDDLLMDMATFIRAGHFPCHVVFDEFQEITRLKDSGVIEGLIRSGIQGLNASFIFAGSRRGVIRAMFEDRDRAFFQSATKMELPPLPGGDAVDYLSGLFNETGKIIEPEQARAIVEFAEGHPFYIQKIAGEAYAVSEETVDAEAVGNAYKLAMESEVPLFEAILARLTPPQIRLLKAVAAHAPSEILGREFTTAAGMQPSLIGHSRKRLTEEDLIEKTDGRWRVVDPLFRCWLRKLSA